MASNIDYILKNNNERMELEKLLQRAHFIGPIYDSDRFMRDLTIYVKKPMLFSQFNPRYGFGQGLPQELNVSGAAVVYNPNSIMESLAMYLINERYHYPPSRKGISPIPEEKKKALLENLIEKIKIGFQPNVRGNDIKQVLRYFASEDSDELIKAVRQQLSLSKIRNKLKI